MRLLRQRILFWIYVLIIAMLVIGLGTSVGETMPDNALVVIDQAGKYHSLLGADHAVGTAEATTAKVAQNAGLKPCEICRNDGDFRGYTVSTLRAVFSGLTGWWKPESRWDDQGGWKW